MFIFSTRAEAICDRVMNELQMEIVNYFEWFFKQNYQIFPTSSSGGNFLPFSILLHVITNFYLWLGHSLGFGKNFSNFIGQI